MRFIIATSCIAVAVLLSIPAQAQEQKKYWVYFTDKGEHNSSTGTPDKRAYGYSQAMTILSPRALQRRAKTLPPESLISTEDFPVYQPYIAEIEQAGASMQMQSRWLNAVSVLVTPEEVSRISRLPFVKAIAPVIMYKGKHTPRKEEQGFPRFGKATTLDYGYSYAQVDMVNAIPLHQIGITGKDVRIGVLDSGFRWKTHEATKSRNVLAEYDFIFHDEETANEAIDSPTQDEHGTFTFSALGGFKPGELIGPAYGAEFLLAKTEYIPSETQVEEDFWTAGIEWLEAQGADIVSSSLGYNTFEDDSNYTWENGDFDGRTSVTAKAAIRAARLGVLICNAMGNEGKGDGIHGTMLTPADADSILSVGAINFSRRVAGFSSTGPTNDGRTKPDVVAVGANIYCASPGTDSYRYVQGTSLATPLVAGCAALVLSARPELTAMQIRDAIRSTADTANAEVNAMYHLFPNNFLGWGLVNGLKAALEFGPIFSNQPQITVNGSSGEISTVVVSKYGIKPDSVLLYYKTGNDEPYQSLSMVLDSSMLFETSGRYRVAMPSLPPSSTVKFYIEASDSAGNSYQSPAPVLNKQWQFCCGATGVWSDKEMPDVASLLQNYPNPFNSTTTVTFELKQCEQAEVAVYSLTGQKIKSLYNALAMPLQYQAHWDGVNELGESVASGVYLVRLTTPSFTSTKSMLLLR